MDCPKFSYKLDHFIRDRRPQYKTASPSEQDDLDYHIEYFFPNEPNTEFTLIPKTNSIDLFRDTVNYISNVRTHSFSPFYVATCKNILIKPMNDVGSVLVRNEDGIFFEDISTRYFKAFKDFDFSILKNSHFDGTSVLLSLDSASNYFHWTCQLLPRVKLLQEYGVDWSKINKILIPQIRGDFVKQSLAILGVPLDKLIEQEKHHVLNFDSLIIPCKANTHIHLSRWSIEFLRESFLKDGNQKPTDNIYIARRESFGRNLKNEEEVLKVLKEHDFKVIFCEDYSITEQAEIFNRAKCIVAPHGAALANLAYCQPKTKVIEIFNHTYKSNLYWNFANILGLNYFYYVTPEEHALPETAKFEDKKADTMHMCPRVLKTMLEMP